MSSEERLLSTFRTLVQDPEFSEYAAPDDGLIGQSVIAQQTIQVDVSAPSGQPCDMWVVNTGFEVQAGDNLVADFTIRGTNGSTQYPLNQAPNYSQLTNPTAGQLWGGLMIYMMSPGQSPFPSSTATTVGPCPPLATYRLVYDSEMIPDLSSSDQVRVIGSSFEVIDTTANLYQQGNSVAASFVHSNNNRDLFNFSTNTDLSGVSGYLGTTVAQHRFLPPGDIESLRKQPGAYTGKAKDGIFAYTPSVWPNVPSGGFNNAVIYEGGDAVTPTPSDLGNVSLLVGNVNAIQMPTVSLTQTLVTYPGPMSASRLVSTSEIAVAVFTGLPAQYTASVQRKITVQRFVAPGSPYVAFAKVQQGKFDPIGFARICNAIAEIPRFYPSSYNRTGAFARLAKKAFNATKKVAGTVAKAALPAATRGLLAGGPMGAMSASLPVVRRELEAVAAAPRSIARPLARAFELHNSGSSASSSTATPRRRLRSARPNRARQN